jgi:hypothetical protein
VTDPTLILLTIGGFICVTCLLVGIAIQAFPGSRFAALAVPLLRKRRSTLSDYNGFAAFTKSEVGDIERCIPCLQKVIIISSKVENPSKSLLDAVFDNFQQGVEYIFLVSSNGNSDIELSEYRDWFQSIYTSAKGIAPETGINSKILNLEFTALFSVRKLNVDWDSVPYIFYVFSEDDETSVLALRGGDAGSGISTMYFRVHPHDAAAIIELSQSASSAIFEGIDPSQVDYSGSLPRTEIEAAPLLRLVG